MSKELSEKAFSAATHRAGECPLCSHDRAQRDRIAEQDREIARLKEDASTVAHLRKCLNRFPERPQLGDNLTDSEVAGMVRMLMRDDPSHEIICLIARDRILWLSDQVKRLTEERDAAKLRLGLEWSKDGALSERNAEIATLRAELEAATKDRDHEYFFQFPDPAIDYCGPYRTIEELKADSGWTDLRWKPFWRFKGISPGPYVPIDRAAVEVQPEGEKP